MYYIVQNIDTMNVSNNSMIIFEELDRNKFYKYFNIMYKYIYIHYS